MGKLAKLCARGRDRSGGEEVGVGGGGTRFHSGTAIELSLADFAARGWSQLTRAFQSPATTLSLA